MTELNEEEVIGLLRELNARLDRLEQRIGQPAQDPKREWTPDELAKQVNRAAFTIREWCRLNRIPSRVDSKGRRWISDEIAQKVIAYGGLPAREELVV